jgi:hypothetical protein
MKKYPYIDPKTAKPDKIKKVLAGPITESYIKIGQVSERITTVPHRVNRQIPRAASIVVSAAYNHATGPEVF